MHRNTLFYGTCALAVLLSSCSESVSEASGAASTEESPAAKVVDVTDADFAEKVLKSEVALVDFGAPW